MVQDAEKIVEMRTNDAGKNEGSENIEESGGINDLDTNNAIDNDDNYDDINDNNSNDNDVNDNNNNDNEPIFSRNGFF